MNKICRCGVHAVIKSSESQPHKHKLYYKCENNTCNFFEWVKECDDEQAQYSTINEGGNKEWGENMIMHG